MFANRKKRLGRGIPAYKKMEMRTAGPAVPTTLVATVRIESRGKEGCLYTFLRNEPNLFSSENSIYTIG